MKILVAVDGSAPSVAAVEEVARRPWPAGSEVRLVTVVQPPPWMPEPFTVSAETHAEMLRAEERKAAGELEELKAKLCAARPETPVGTRIRVGSAKEQLIEEAASWAADLLVVGTHGRGAVGRFVLGSVAHAVALHAPCSVEIVRRAA
jgi:nucleotide-binding universal stress UspA family protein